MYVLPDPIWDLIRPGGRLVVAFREGGADFVVTAIRFFFFFFEIIWCCIVRDNPHMQLTKAMAY